MTLSIIIDPPKWFGILLLAIVMVACSQLDFAPKALSNEAEDFSFLALSQAKSLPTVTPELHTGKGGNVNCSDIGEYENTSGRIDFNPKNNTFSGTFPEGFSLKVTDGKYVSWKYSCPHHHEHHHMHHDDLNGHHDCHHRHLDAISVIVKGGNASHEYKYTEGENQDHNLVSPFNKGAKIPQVSNITLCFTFISK
jgi:hypothetical protein